MPTADSYQEAIRRTLTLRSEAPPDASEVAEATLQTWQRMADELVPVLGSHGADVLFGRSLYITSTHFPWLAIIGEHGNSTAQLANLKARLADRETDTAAEASYTLLVTFVELLISLIGESLTERLLAPVWVQRLPASEQESET